MTTTQPAGKRDHFTDFDLDSPEFTEEYEQVLGDLVEKCPVARSNVAGGYWVVSRYEDVRACAQDWETFSSEAGGFEPGRAAAEAKLYPVELDPPYQTRWRNVLGPYFAPRAIREREASIREQADALIDTFIETGECDFVADFAAHLPGRVFFATFLGVPLADLDGIQTATDVAMRGAMEDRPAAWDIVGGFLADYLAKRQEEPPRGDFVDVVLAGVEDHEGNPASFTHKMFIMIDLLAGGIGTTTFLLAGMAHHLATNDVDRARLLADESLHANAVEELIRYFSSIVALGRTAMKDTEVAGQKITKGDFLMLSFAAACRDSSVFANPNEIDIDRKIAVNPAFSFGPHRCIGSHVARLEGTVTLKRLLERMPDLRLKPGAEPTYSNSTITRNMDSLPLVFTPGPKVG
ncbi:MAG: cytochrome P450 [Sporichthyaceae bacterium]